MAINLRTRFFWWMSAHWPEFTSNLQDFSYKVDDWLWRRREKRNRCCCETTLLEHCAEKLNCNTKKAVCEAYLPSYCNTCGRRIPQRMRYKYMMLSRFIEHMRDWEQEDIEIRFSRSKRLHDTDN